MIKLTPVLNLAHLHTAFRKPWLKILQKANCYKLLWCITPFLFI